MRTSALVAAALASLPGCVVSTNDLKPKTAADCQPFEKPCGYRCVNADEAATGCGNTSCDPVDLSTDPGHCGACGHTCVATACSNAVCQPESLLRGGPVGDLRGIVQWKGTFYWLEGSQGGRLLSWSPAKAFTDANTIVLFTSLDAATGRSGAPSAFRIAANPALNRIYVAGSGGGLPTDNLTIWEIDPTAPTPTKASFYSEAALTGMIVDGIAATAAGVHYVRSDDLRLAFAPPGAVTPTFIATANTEPLHGLAALGGDVYFGHSAAFGTLSRVTGAGSEVPVLTGVSTRPDRLAALQNAGITDVAFASELDGSARLLNGATVIPMYGGNGVPNPIDVASDANGVYFFDRSIGEVLEFRSDGWFFPLARGATPFGIAVDSTYVYWTDGSGAVMRVPK